MNPKEKKSLQYNSVEEYLTAQDSPEEQTLRTIIEFILTQFPELESAMSYDGPQIHRDGEDVFGLTAYKHHLLLTPWSSRVIEIFKGRLDNFVVFKNSFRVPIDWDLDEDLIKEMVKARLDELE